MAYMMLAGSYQPQGELTLAAENARKAYDLRERTSDHEKLNIAAFYEIVVTGNLEAARRSYELIAQTYPRDESCPDHALVHPSHMRRLRQGRRGGEASI